MTFAGAQARTTSVLSYLEKLAGLGVTGGLDAVLAGRHACQGDQWPPAEGGTGDRELLAHRAVVLLGVQCPIFTGREPQQHVEDRTRRVTLLAVAVHDRTGERLIVGLDGGFEIA